MIDPAEPSTPSGPPVSITKATDHELQKHDKFTRYGHVRFIAGNQSSRWRSSTDLVCPCPLAHPMRLLN